MCTDFDSCTTYRNVDMSNMFPAASSATNWFDPNGLKAKEAIEASATSGEIYKVSNDDNIYLEYSVTLNPEQMRNINSNYNDTAYTDNTLINC